MDWANERYVRWYTRDTITWKRWSWSTRGAFGLLLRKVDRAGVLDCEGMDHAEALAVMLEIPEDVAATALEELEKTGTIVVKGSQVVVPSFLEAQETAQSDAQRQRESRARRRDLAVSGVTNRDEMSRPVTSGHAASQPVTSCHSRPDQTNLPDQPDQTDIFPPPPKGGAKKAPPSPDAIYVAQYLYDSIRSHSPEFCAGIAPSKLEAKLAGWARDIDVGLRNDGMIVDGCVAAIHYAHASDDEFWRPNILSGKKLRKHYQSLLIKATRANHDPNICTIADGDWDWKKHVS